MPLSPQQKHQLNYEIIMIIIYDNCEDNNNDSKNKNDHDNDNDYNT